jgi:hypothetical protein
MKHVPKDLDTIADVVLRWGNTHTRPSSNFALARYCLRMYAVSTP